MLWGKVSYVNKIVRQTPIHFNFELNAIVFKLETRLFIDK